MDVTIRELAGWLKGMDDIAVFGHRAPDGDACGSCVAVTLALRALGKRACAYLPGGMPEFLRFLPGQECVVADASAPFVPQCALSVDVSAPDMLGDNRALFESCPQRAVLDHHESNPHFGQINHVEPDRAACGEIALLLIEALGAPLSKDMAACLFAAVSSDTGNFNYSNTTAETFEAAAACGEIALLLIEAMGAPLSKDMAACLFAAVSSDTGNFNYSNTTAETFEAAAACVRAGADVDEITGRIYRTRTEARTRLLGLVLAGLQREGKVAWARVTNDMFHSAGALRCDTERIVNYLIEIGGVEIAVLAIEQEDGCSAKFSLRSLAPYNVARDVAQTLGGGGHERAAGITIHRPLREALDLVLARVREIL